MASQEQTNNDIITKLESEIVKIPVGKESLPKDKKVDKNKLLGLAKKIRESYDNNDIALNGAHQPS